MKQLIVFDTSSVISAGAFNKAPILVGPVIPTDKGFKQWSMPIGGIKFLFNYLYKYKQYTLVFAMNRIPIYKQDIYPGYKGNRTHASYKDLAIYEQRKIAELILNDIGFNVFYEEGFEADDITYSIWKDNIQTVDTLDIVTNDSDYFFMITPKCSIIPSSSKGKIVNIENYSKVAVKDYFIPYNSILVYKTIFGDLSDNIASISSKSNAYLYDSFCKLGNVKLMGSRSYIERIASNFVGDYKDSFYQNLNIIHPFKRPIPSIQYNSVDYDKLSEWGRALEHYMFGKAETSSRINHLLESWILDEKI